MAILASSLMFGLAVLGEVAVGSGQHRTAGLLFLACAAALLLCCVFALRRAASMRLPALLAAMASLVCLAFTDFGRGNAGWTYTTPTATHYSAGSMPVALLLGVTILATQVAGRFAQRNSCSCE